MVTGDASDFYNFAAELETAAGRIGAPAAAAVRKTATAIEADAKALAPEGPSGDLRSSIHVEFYGDGRHAGMAAEIIADVPYARFVEEGTSKMAPQPYMAPAGERHAPALGEALAGVMDKLL